jgi:DNA polymerase III sliding clamp (beta) subunit (PCNA family)
MRADIKEAIVLAKALAFAAKATPARSTIPILTHAKLAVTGNQLEPASR